MKRKNKLPVWSKEVMKAMIDQDMTVTELATELNLNRCYISRVVNASTYAPVIADRIGNRLGVKEPYMKNIIS